jgi:hypothetical protein
LQETRTAIPTTVSTECNKGCCQASVGLIGATTMTTVVVIAVVIMSPRRSNAIIINVPRVGSSSLLKNSLFIPSRFETRSFRIAPQHEGINKIMYIALILRSR